MHDTGLIFKGSRDETNVFYKNIFGYYNICTCIDISLSKTVTDDQLLCKKN